LQAAAEMKLVAVGINHRTASLEVREKLWMSDDEIRTAISQLKENSLRECFIVSTCNRTELYGIADETKNSFPEGTSFGDFLKDLLIGAKSASQFVKREHLYHLNSIAAVNHLFKVASGIDSMIIGDMQILGQVKDGFTCAVEQKTNGLFLNHLVQTALHVGKRTRTETAISEGAVSVSYAAVELANKIFSDLSARSALLIGAGETGELTAKHLVGRGIGNLFITNRTRSKAEELVSSLGGSVVEFDALHQKIPQVDIVISSVGTQEFVITKSELQRAMKERSHKPLFIIDIGVPRNFDPEANKIENVFLHDMDALSGIVDQNLEKRKSELPKVNAIILQELTEFYKWYESLQVNPTIHDLREHFEQVRTEEVAKHINRFSPQDRELVDLVTKRIVNKLLHVPTTSLKNGNGETEEEKHNKLHIVRSLFGLNK
jgi:glutamyl-tRNA reductase